MVDWSKAAAHLRGADPVLARVIDRVGPCSLSPRPDYFLSLCRAIYGQQISTKVAAVLFERFRDLFPRKKPTPKVLLKIFDGDSAELAGCGLSRQKRIYLRDLAHCFHTRKIPVRGLARMGDDEVIKALVQVKGVGRWTAEMFLIFTLNRPDVLPVDDLGLQTSVRDVYRLAARPGAAQLTQLAEPWRPYRTLASWYLWRHLECAATDAKRETGAAAITVDEKRKRLKRPASAAMKKKAIAPRREK